MGAGATIPVEKVAPDTLKKIVEFCEKHKGAEVAEPAHGQKKTTLEEWDKEFCESMDKPALFKLVVAADYLRCQLLLDVACLAIALMIKGKTPDEIKREFPLPKK